MNSFTWDTSDAQDAKPDDGQYEGYLKSFQMKDSKSSSTQYLSLEFTIKTMLGDKTVFDNVFINSTSEEGKRINNQKMASLCFYATGKKGVKVNLNEVVNKKIIIVLKTKDDPKFGEQQKVSYYKKWTDLTSKQHIQESVSPLGELNEIPF